MPPDPLRQENHALLSHLSDSMAGVTDALGKFMDEQRSENRNIHRRIDETDDRMNKGIADIKVSLANHGRLSPGIALNFATIVIALSTLVGGMVTAYVSVRLENIRPVIEATNARVTQDEKRHEQLSDQLHTVEINAERNAAAVQRDLYWIERGMKP